MITLKRENSTVHHFTFTHSTLYIQEYYIDRTERERERVRDVTWPWNKLKYSNTISITYHMHIHTHTHSHSSSSTGSSAIRRLVDPNGSRTISVRGLDD